MNYKKLEEEITQLSKEWCQLVAKGYHKDRDYHWHIETTWSYGEPPTFTIQHHGYIHDPIKIGFKSYEDALKSLILILSKAIAKERAVAIEKQGQCQTHQLLECESPKALTKPNN